MDCVNCGAPLPPKSQVCDHCGSVNDVDLRAIQRSTRRGKETDRTCPHCACKLRSVDIGVKGGFVVEQCSKCMGVFFDPGELESLLDSSVSHVYEVDHARLARLIEEEGIQTVDEVRYVACPVCGELMNRRSYGRRSGVIVDTCKEHGVWLDGGELRQLLKWMKAGGHIYDKISLAEERRREERKRRARKVERDTEYGSGGYATPGWGHQGDLLEGAIRAIFGFTR
jgi:Zn-finger nucleic acid-binding protein